MKTQMVGQPTDSMARLERYPSDGGPAESTPLTASSTTIGRDESADLCIPSGRVSREHAVIVVEGGRSLIRDLGSTNGTFVNGERVTETAINDGDVIGFADVEFTFVISDPAASRANHTQVIDPVQDATGRIDDSDAIIREVRRLQELVSGRQIRTLLAPIVRFSDGTVFAYAVTSPCIDPESSRPAEQTFLAGVDCNVVERLRQATRLVAADAAASHLPDDTLLLMDIHCSEFGTDHLADSILRVDRRLHGKCRLGVRVPNHVATNTPYFRELRSRLTEAKILVALGGFAASGAQLREHEANPPDLLELEDSLIRYLHRDSKQNNQVKAIVDACRDLGVEVIAAGIRSEKEHHACHELGCDYAVGPFYGNPEPASAAAVSGST